MIQVTEEFFEIIRNSHQITTLMVFFDWDESVTFDIPDYDHLKTFEPDMRTPITPATQRASTMKPIQQAHQSSFLYTLE